MHQRICRIMMLGDFLMLLIFMILSHASVEMEDEDGTCLLDVLW